MALFLSPSDVYVKSFLYLFYILIKHYTQMLWANQASSLTPDRIPPLWRPRILASFAAHNDNLSVSSTYMKLLKFLQPTLIPTCNSSSPAFLMMWSACRLDKQGDRRQPCCSPFSNLNQSVISYRILTVASWPTHRFLRRQARRSGNPIILIVCHDPNSQRL